MSSKLKILRPEFKLILITFSTMFFILTYLVYFLYAANIAAFVSGNIDHVQ